MSGYPPKRVNVIAALLKEESSVGGGVSVDGSTDGFQLQYADKNVGAICNIHYDDDGQVGPPVAELGTLRRAPMSGRWIDGSLPFRFKGPGAAYSSSALPTIHRMMKACGYTPTLDTSSGSESYRYDPTVAATTPTSLGGMLYARGVSYPVVGLFADLSIDGTKPGPWMFEAKFEAVLSGLPSDAAVPGVAYPSAAIVSPLGVGTVVNIGDYSAVKGLRGIKFAQNRKWSGRPNQDATAGRDASIPESRNPIVTVIMEATALASSPYHTSVALNPYRLREEGTSLAVSVQGAGAQYNRIKYVSPQSTVVDVRETNDGAVALWEIDLEAFMTTPTANDDHYWLLN